MTGRRWILSTIATVVTVVGIVDVFGYAIDPYGVLRNPAGRELSVYFSERRAKFLMSKRYVPANFNGLIIGPSAADNWDIPTLAGDKIYNESLSGGDAAEEQIVVNEAMQKGQYKLAIFLLFPSMTSSHKIMEGLDKVSTSEAIASFHLFVNEAAFVFHATHHKFGISNTAPNGQFISAYPKRFEVTTLPPSFFQTDPIAVEQYRNMVLSLQDRGSAIVYIFPPIYEPMYELNKSSFQTYLRTIRTLLPPAPVIDLDGPQYNDLRSDPNNYFDCYHLEPQGTARVAALLEKLVPQAIASGK